MLFKINNINVIKSIRTFLDKNIFCNKMSTLKILVKVFYTNYLQMYDVHKY